MEVARGHAASYPLTLAAAETRLRLSALLAGASPDQDVTFERVRGAPELAIAALSAEPVAEYGPILRSQGPGIVIPVGYTDTVFGYLPSARMLGQHGYEDEGFMKAFGIAGRFRPDIEEVVRRAPPPPPPPPAPPPPPHTPCPPPPRVSSRLPPPH